MKERRFSISSNRTAASSSMELSPEGSLLVYYISNLILLCKYQDAFKAIDQFGLKL
jgi:hypothetical protein